MSILGARHGPVNSPDCDCRPGRSACCRCGAGPALLCNPCLRDQVERAIAPYQRAMALIRRIPPDVLVKYLPDAEALAAVQSAERIARGEAS